MEDVYPKITQYFSQCEVDVDSQKLETFDKTSCGKRIRLAINQNTHIKTKICFPYQYINEAAVDSSASYKIALDMLKFYHSGAVEKLNFFKVGKMEPIMSPANMGTILRAMYSCSSIDGGK